jgi:hypothetical protein
MLLLFILSTFNACKTDNEEGLVSQEQIQEYISNLNNSVIGSLDLTDDEIEQIALVLVNEENEDWEKITSAQVKLRKLSPVKNTQAYALIKQLRREKLEKEGEKLYWSQIQEQDDWFNKINDLCISIYKKSLMQIGDQTIYDQLENQLLESNIAQSHVSDRIYCPYEDFPIVVAPGVFPSTKHLTSTSNSIARNNYWDLGDLLSGCDFKLNYGGRGLHYTSSSQTYFTDLVAAYSNYGGCIGGTSFVPNGVSNANENRAISVIVGRKLQIFYGWTPNSISILTKLSE